MKDSTLENRKKNATIMVDAIDKYGALEQCLMAQEEAAELIQAINKYRRMGGITCEGIKFPDKNSSIKESLAYDALCGEVADMEIMLRQMKLMLRGDQVDLIKQRKINRLESRLKKS